MKAYGLKRHLLFLSLCGAASLWEQSSYANSLITVEAVDNYSCGPLHNNQNNVQNFMNRMLESPIPNYNQGLLYFNSNVWSTDFLDPSRVAGGQDMYNFDRPSDAISYFSGHGACDDQTSTACISAAGCPVISGLQAICTRYTESPLSGRCMYNRPRTLITDRTGTSCSLVNYSTGQTAFGESATFNWAGAGTDGGVNFTVIDVSCGMTPTFYGSETANSFAGLSTLATIMPTRFGSDTIDSYVRGRVFADRYVANPNSAMAVQWADSLNNQGNGGSCAFGGGGHGIGGCGANISISSDADIPGATFSNRQERWTDYSIESNDANGSGALVWIFTCNYNCNAHPFTL